MFEQFENYVGPDLDFIWKSSCYPKSLWKEGKPVEHWIYIEMYRSKHGICNVHVSIFDKSYIGQYKYYKHMVDEMHINFGTGPISLAQSLLEFFKLIESYECQLSSSVSVSSGVHGFGNDPGKIIIDGYTSKLPIWCIENIFVYHTRRNREYILFCQWLESYFNLYLS